MTGQPRWFTDTKDGHSQWYVDRFRTLAAEGADLEGEARLVDAMLPRGARVLDAGCGPGRLAGALHARGHQVWGVDVDPVLVEAAEVDHPGPTYRVADLSTLELDTDPFDLVVSAGNVMLFLAPGTERQVLTRLRAQLVPDGRLVLGFRKDPEGYTVADLDTDAEAVGFALEHRFATWDLVPWTEESDFAVTVLRRR
ncbi:class I SAM-dependent methyltransferase [Nocardioides campestrisoli]|uniref:class I SAM-dependent methyltransferase n=1 Tax=Nocardioides campestrisoli TaxID=2736757 RepID=UPI0015E7DA68|nr:class I SAM-dependent methyltransferase [Nocardioides campestrisoli]